MFRPHPLLLRCAIRLGILPPWIWITWSPNVYHPVDLDPEQFPGVQAHERVHLAQQEGHRGRWLWRYVTRRSFRLHQEAQGIAVEILAARDPIQQRSILESYVEALAGRSYWWAAESPAEARAAILDAVDALLIHRSG